jgi:hypothetical protein
MSFKDSLSIEVELEEFVNEEARILSFSLLSGLTRITPVDTGRARGNWFVGLNAPNRSIDESRSAGSALSDGAATINKTESVVYPSIIISNNLPYIERLNDGHSQQAPAKFVESEISRVVNSRKSNGR